MHERTGLASCLLYSGTLDLAESIAGMDESPDSPDLTGTGSRGIALAVGGIGTAMFAALALAIVLTPATPSTGQIVGGLICAMLGAAILPIQLADAACRRHRLTDSSVVYRHGLISTSEIEIPYAHVHAVTIRQNLLQKLLRCGDIRLTTHGVVPSSGLVTSSDMHSLVLRSVSEHEMIGDELRARMREHAS